MTRIRKLTLEELDPELRNLTDADNRTPLELGLTRIFGHRPPLMKGMMAFAGSLKRNRTIPEKLVELVRLRVAFHNQCRSCLAIRYTDSLNDGLTEDLVCSFERPMEAEGLTDAEKIAIRFGELMATNHLAIDDEFYDRLREHFTEPQIVELGLNIALFVGVGRLAATLNMIEELPTEFQEAEYGKETLSPWNNASIVVR